MDRQLTVTVDASVFDALQRAAQRDGVPEGELVDEALRRWFGLRGIGVLEDLAQRRTGADRLDDEAAMALALREVRAARARRRAQNL